MIAPPSPEVARRIKQSSPLHGSRLEAARLPGAEACAGRGPCSVSSRMLSTRGGDAAAAADDDDGGS